MILDPYQIFNLSSFLVLPAWVLLIFLPRSQWTQKLVLSGLISAILALIYIVAMVISFPIFQEGGGFSTFDQVKVLFSSEWALLAGWIHYLCFDLLIGISVSKSLENKSVFIRAIFLSLVFMFGPLGWVFSQIFQKWNFSK